MTANHVAQSKMSSCFFIHNINLCTQFLLYFLCSQQTRKIFLLEFIYFYNYKSQTIQSMMPTLTLLFLVLLLAPILAINIIHQKKNILIKQNSSYIYQITLAKQNANLIPSYVTVQYDISNYNGTSSNYFDFFYYVSAEDIQCYNSAIGNESYLFPCPFLSNNYAVQRINKLQKLTQMPKLQINKLQNLNNTFIIDNTRFPFPTGAYPYTDININIKTSISVQISSSYEQLAARLIAIDSTVLAIFLTIIGCLFYKQRKIRRQMQGEKKSNLLGNKFDGQDETSKNQNDQSSDSQQQQNYTEFLGRTALQPSLLQSKQRSLFIDQ